MNKFQQSILIPLTAIAMFCTLAASTAYALDISIDVSPNVLNLESNGVVVTVHTDVAYSAVIGSTVYLNGVAIDWWKADDRGNFVAKFDSDEVKTLDGLIIGDYNELVLSGYTVGGEAFIGSQYILVIENLPKGKK